MSSIGSLQESSIEVSWTMTQPSLEPKKWHRFPSDSKLPATSAKNAAIEDAFPWPRGTITALEHAFELHLSRSIGWQLDGLTDRAAWIQAAQVFRRGIAYSGQTARELSGSYSVRFQPGKKPPELFKEQGPYIVDANVAKAWKLNLRAQDLQLDLHESTKTLETAAQIKNWIKKHPGKVSIIGGGILADVAAFSSALENRPFRLIPTTLLAMLDACIGGKTGVNFGRFGKNQLGLFAFPEEVVIAPAWLQSLGEREFKAGLAEGYKHALIKGDAKLGQAVADLSFSIEAIEPYLSQLVAVKAQIISEDPSEAGKRAVLNFGHTLAHALEKVSQKYASQDPILHGEAIGIGMRFALSLSHSLGHLKSETFATIDRQLKNSKFLLDDQKFREHMGLRALPDHSLLDLLAEGVMQDKKNQDSGSSEWVLLRDWGQFVERGKAFTAPVTHPQFREFCRAFLLDSGLIDSSLEVKL